MYVHAMRILKTVQWIPLNVLLVFMLQTCAGDVITRSESARNPYGRVQRVLTPVATLRIPYTSQRSALTASLTRAFGRTDSMFHRIVRGVVLDEVPRQASERPFLGPSLEFYLYPDTLMCHGVYR